MLKLSGIRYEKNNLLEPRVILAGTEKVEDQNIASHWAKMFGMLRSKRGHKRDRDIV